MKTRRPALAGLLTAAALMFGQAPAHADIDWKPGRTRETVSVNMDAGWRAAATYTWRSGRRDNGAYVVDPTRRVYRLTWVRPGEEPDCSPGIGDLIATQFKTVFQQADGRVVYRPGTRRRACPDDGISLITIKDRGWRGQVLSYTRNGAPPVVWTSTFWEFWLARDHEVELRGFKMTYRGRQMPLPW